MLSVLGHIHMMQICLLLSRAKLEARLCFWCEAPGLHRLLLWPLTLGMVDRATLRARVERETLLHWAMLTNDSRHSIHKPIPHDLHRGCW